MSEDDMVNWLRTLKGAKASRSADRILRELRQAGTRTTAELAITLNAHRDVIQAELHKMEDAGQVIMRNGFYRISEAARSVAPDLSP